MTKQDKDTKELRELKKFIRDELADCSGCVDDPNSEGTHQGWTKQHFEEVYLNPVIDQERRKARDIGIEMGLKAGHKAQKRIYD